MSWRCLTTPCPAPTLPPGPTPTFFFLRKKKKKKKEEERNKKRKKEERKKKKKERRTSWMSKPGGKKQKYRKRGRSSNEVFFCTHSFSPALLFFSFSPSFLFYCSSLFSVSFFFFHFIYFLLVPQQVFRQALKTTPLMEQLLELVAQEISESSTPMFGDNEDLV